jgi:hypothetical protein
MKAISLVSDEEDVRVRKASFLELNDAHESCHISQHTVDLEIAHKLIDLLFEYSGNDVWSIMGLLPTEEGLLNFRPLRVACEGYEEVRFVVNSHNGHGVLEVGVVESWTASERAWKYDLLTRPNCLSRVVVGVCMDVFTQSLVRFPA